MAKAFRASRLMGLLALALGIMAFGATAAQADPGAKWLINKTAISGSLLPELQVKELEKNHGILLTKVGLSSVEILCTGLTFVDVLLHELGRATGKLLFSGCLTKLNGNAAPACNPTTAGSTAGHITTNALKGLLKLHTGGIELLEVLPQEGAVFVTFAFGAECAIGTKFDVTGKAFLKDCLNEGLVDKVLHLVEQGPLTELKFGANAATIHGSAIVGLAGAHETMLWAGHV